MARSRLLPVLCLLAIAAPARAGDTPATGAPPAKAAKQKQRVEADPGPFIEWRVSYRDAAEEASERNVVVVLHSHASTCPPCKALHRSVFHDAAYVAWANERTIHLLSYALAKEPTEPEPVVEVERAGERVVVLAHYPRLTADEATTLVNEINAGVTFPMTTPWTGILAPDAHTVRVAKPGRVSAKEVREAWEAEQARVGPALPRADWKKIRGLLDLSSQEEFDEKFAEATKHALEARAVAKVVAEPLRERLDARVQSLENVARHRLEKAVAVKDPAVRAKALAAIQADFRGLPAADAAKDAAGGR